MLIDFTVENYRSIKEPVTLSAIAMPRRAPRVSKSDSAQSEARRSRIVPDEEIAQTYMAPGTGFELLPTLGVFGANASGKSNVLHALAEFLWLISVGDRDGNSLLEAMPPFMLSRRYANAPTKLGLRVLVGNEIFEYLLSFGRQRILSETLCVSDGKKSQLLFDRTWDVQNELFKWKNGALFTDAYLAIQKVTAPYFPFVSVLMRGLTVPVIASWQNWLKASRPVSTTLTEQEQHEIILNSLMNSAKDLTNAAEFVRQFDTGIEEVSAVHSNEDVAKSLLVTHRTEDGPVVWDLENESRGTQNLLFLSPKILWSLKHGSLILEDELGSNIHPNVTRKIIQLFQNEQTNPRHAQLIFTSHDNTLQRHNLLRRDQVWFTEKRADGSTNLYALTDFKPRNDLALDQAYLDGRYGAVPVLPALENVLPQNLYATSASESVR